MMTTSQPLRKLITASALVSVLSLATAPAAVALTGVEVNNIAREVTVLCAGTQGQQGSGVIVSQSGETYFVVTAKHVVSLEDDYRLVAPDKQTYSVEYEQIQYLPNVDLAVLPFTSDRNYAVATLANSDLVQEGQTVFVSGWPTPGAIGQASGGSINRQFTQGTVSGYLEQPLQGYEMGYTNTTRRGMSGGPVLDGDGRVIAIHGLADYEDPEQIHSESLNPEERTDIAGLIKAGFNYGIPTNTFLETAPQAGVYLSLMVEATPASELTQAEAQVPTEQDPRDTIDDLNATLDAVGQTLDIIQQFRNIFQF